MIEMKPISRAAEVAPSPSNREGDFGPKDPAHHEPKLIQLAFQHVYKQLEETGYVPGLGYLSYDQEKVLQDIALCKTPEAGYSVWQCTNCLYQSFNYNKCKNRNCPVCQNLKSLVWLDNRSVEVIDAPYFHVVMTLPHELNPLIYSNQKLLYSLLLKSVANAITELGKDPKYLGGKTGTIQVLHTWNQQLEYHVHSHVIVPGAGLTEDNKLVYAPNEKFFIPETVVAAVVKGKYMEELKSMYEEGRLCLEGGLAKYRNRYEWKSLVNNLYDTKWVCYIKETFNGNGNAMEYLARYTNKIAIGNSRIVSVTKEKVVFTYRGEDGRQSEKKELSTAEFVRRYLMHVLPSGFQKIRYNGFLANGCRKKYLEIIFNEIQERQQFLHRLKEPTESEALRVYFGIDVKKCPCCGKEDSMLEVSSKEGELSHVYTPDPLKKPWKKKYRKRVFVKKQTKW